MLRTKPLLGTFFVTLLCLFGGSDSIQAATQFEWNGVVSTNAAQEAWLIFEGEVRIQHDFQPNKEMIREAIHQQIHYLPGPMQYPHDGGYATTGHDFGLSNIRIRKINSESSIWYVQYHYQGLVLAPTPLASKKTIYLAVEPSKLYQATLDPKSEHNPCTDEQLQSEDDLWHFWSPERPGCKLKKDIDYIEVIAQVSGIASRSLKRPEFERMMDSKGVIRVSMLFGLNDPVENANPVRSIDIAARNFQHYQNELLLAGFERTQHSDFQVRMNSYEESYEKTYSATPDRPVKKVEIQLFLGSSKNRSPRSKRFSIRLKEAFEKSALVIYDGHSGLGRNLRLSAIRNEHDIQIHFDSNRYQIFMLDSCNSYEYWKREYFATKASGRDPVGSKNLDLIVNGLQSQFMTGASRSGILLRALDRWISTGQFTSYAEIIDQFADSGSYPVVLGEEDNPSL